MPAAAVIPAPLAYTIIVAVKRLVVGLNTYILELFVHFSFLLETVHTNPFFHIFKALYSLPYTHKRDAMRYYRYYLCGN